MYEDEGRARGQDGTGGPAAPLSVDGLILAASLVLLHEARTTATRQHWPGSSRAGWTVRPSRAPH